MWPWSSYLATGFDDVKYSFLTVDWVLSQFGKIKKEAQRAYLKFVDDGISNKIDNPWSKLVGQIVFGGVSFIADIQSRINDAEENGEIPRFQRFLGRPSLGIMFPENRIIDKDWRNKQIESAHVEYGYTLKEIAEQLKNHYTTVSKVLKNNKLQFKT